MVVYRIFILLNKDKINVIKQIREISLVCLVFVCLYMYWYVIHQICKLKIQM